MLGPATQFSDSRNPMGWLLQENLAEAIPGGGGAKFQIPTEFTNAEVFDVPKSLLGSGDLGTWRKKRRLKSCYPHHDGFGRGSNTSGRNLNKQEINIQHFYKLQH